MMMMIKKMIRICEMLLLIAIIALLEQNVDCKQKLATWRGPTSFILGNPPIARDRCGLAVALGMFFVFGGNAGSSGSQICCSFGFNLFPLIDNEYVDVIQRQREIAI
jgi:hypothetical protein